MITRPRIRRPSAGLVWLAWRQHRAAHWTALALAALAGALALWLHHHMVTAVGEWAAACPQGLDYSDSATVCGRTPDAVKTVMETAHTPLRYLPVAVGALLGAPLFAQSLQDGTHRLAWTQSVGRGQWVTAKLCVTGAVTALAALLITAPVTWWWYSIRHGRSASGPLGTAWQDSTSQSDWSYLPYTGPAGMAHLLLALAVGAAVGLLLRRVLPAVAVSAGVVLALQTGLESLRPHLLTSALARTSTRAFPERPANSWYLSDGYTHVDGTLTANSPCPMGVWEKLLRCEAAQHINGRYSRYFVPHQFATLQWLESAICLTASALLIAFCLVHVRRMRTR
ncbi:cell wall protein [Streptomyces sp. NPDC096142]|uniref:cell wall protein n=1 Tax=Streptomyces sp. NPDC096142 TaxID=3366077 RepID=UPI003806EC3D